MAEQSLLFQVDYQPAARCQTIAIGGKSRYLPAFRPQPGEGVSSFLGDDSPVMLGR